MIPMVKKCPNNQILSENISLASIYSSQVTEVHFCVKNSYFLIFIKLAIFVLVYQYELQEKLAFNDQYSLFRPIPPKIMVLHIKKTLPNKININFGPPMFTSGNSDFLLNWSLDRILKYGI